MTLLMQPLWWELQYSNHDTSYITTPDQVLAIWHLTIIVFYWTTPASYLSWLEFVLVDIVCSLLLLNIDLLICKTYATIFFLCRFFILLRWTRLPFPASVALPFRFWPLDRVWWFVLGVPCLLTRKLSGGYGFLERSEVVLSIGSGPGLHGARRKNKFHFEIQIYFQHETC